MPDDWVHCAEPNAQCAPFRTITTKDDITKTIKKSAFRGLFQCKGFAPKHGIGLADLFYFNIYEPCEMFFFFETKTPQFLMESIEIWFCF